MSRSSRRVPFVLAFAGFGLPIYGKPCTIHGVEGFAIHRYGRGFVVSHIETGRRVGGPEEATAITHVGAVAVAEAYVVERAREFGCGQDPAGFLRTSLFHQKQSLERYEQAIQEAR